MVAAKERTRIQSRAVDIRLNHSVICRKEGRESHTANLEAFDRYIELLKQQDRVEYATRSTREEEQHQTKYRKLALKTDFHPEFWSYVRTILSHAKPSGFKGCTNPRTTTTKTSHDANAFHQLVHSISPINPINPKILSQLGNFHHRDVVLNELLYATNVGLCSLFWAPECTHCGGHAVTIERDLISIPSPTRCAMCHRHNDVSSLDSIQAFFRFNSDVLYVMMKNANCTASRSSVAATLFCLPVPATGTGSGVRYAVGCGEEESAAHGDVIPPGRYRLRCPINGTDSYLQVLGVPGLEEEPVRLSLSVSELLPIVEDENENGAEAACAGFDIADEKKQHPHDPHHDKQHPTLHRKTFIVPHGKILFDIYPDTQSLFYLWLQTDSPDSTLTHLPPTERQPYTTATDVLHHSIFQTLFRDQIVGSRPSASVQLGFSRVCLVFTDIVGSTDMYARMGDGPAMALVQKHFEILFRSFVANGGRVVKTVGDAVMASFVNGRDAIESVALALEDIQDECLLMEEGGGGTRDESFSSSPNASSLQIRVGMHCGPALIVPLNGINDYFGQTVNIAAKVEAAALASQCLVTDAVLADPDAEGAFEELMRGCRGCSDFEASEFQQVCLKGVRNPVRVRGFRLKR